MLAATQKMSRRNILTLKLFFLPPNTTSKLQRLDLGIIANFKTHYCRLLLRFILASIDTCNSASEVVHSVTILTAIRWISKAWMEVKPETVSRCFRRAGILTEQLCVTSVVQLQGPDPFADVEAEMGLAGLISGVMDTSEQCSSEVYVNGDNELATCVEFDGDTWDQIFQENLGVQNDMENQDSDTEETDILPPLPKVKCYHEALQSLKDVQAFLESRSFFDEASDTSFLIDRVAVLSTVNTKQSTLEDFFSIEN